MPTSFPAAILISKETDAPLLRMLTINVPAQSTVQMSTKGSYWKWCKNLEWAISTLYQTKVRNVYAFMFSATIYIYWVCESEKNTRDRHVTDTWPIIIYTKWGKWTRDQHVTAFIFKKRYIYYFFFNCGHVLVTCRKPYNMGYLDLNTSVTCRSRVVTCRSRVNNIKQRNWA